jgi:sugar-specific transcriptional regulator TrmB
MSTTTDTPEMQDAEDLAGAIGGFISDLKRQRDEAREELANAKKEAEVLATSIYRSEYHSIDSEWSLLDSLAGVISQIDNMYAGIRHQRDEARELARELRDALQLATDECLWRSDSQVPLSEAHSQKLYDVATTALTKAKEVLG